MPKTPQSIIDQLRNDLLISRKARDVLAADTLRSILNAIDNASAVSITSDISLTEVPRREISREDILTIINTEIDEIKQAAEQFIGIDDLHKSELEKKILLLQQYLHDINN